MKRLVIWLVDDLRFLRDRYAEIMGVGRWTTSVRWFALRNKLTGALREQRFEHFEHAEAKAETLNNIAGVCIWEVVDDE